MQLINKNIKKSHDHFFRMMMAEKHVAREFFEAHLPPALLEKIDLNHLEPQSSTFINDLRQEAIADMLFRTRIDEHDAYLYLVIDHQSSPDELMPFRLLKYMVGGMDLHLKNTKGNRIPLVLPIVVYHGDTPWNYSTDLADLVGAPKELVDKYFLKPFTLVDLTQIDDEQIKQKAWAGVMEFTLKHIFARDLLPYIMDIVRLLHELDDADSKQFSETVLKYIVDCGQFNNRKAFVDMVNTELPRNIGGKIMTLAELWIEEGIEKGLEKGIEQGYQKGLTLAQQWKEEGIEKGIEKGIEQGMQQGAENAKWEFVQRLFKVHDDVAEVADLAGLPIEKVRAYQQNQLNSSHS